jgi:hypothetical protein
MVVSFRTRLRLPTNPPLKHGSRHKGISPSTSNTAKEAGELHGKSLDLAGRKAQLRNVGNGVHGCNFRNILYTIYQAVAFEAYHMTRSGTCALAYDLVADLKQFGRTRFGSVISPNGVCPILTDDRVTFGISGITPVVQVRCDWVC